MNDRISLIDSRADVAFESKILGGAVTECDVIVKTVEGGVEKGFVREAGGLYVADDGVTSLTEAALRAKANPAGSALTLTYTAVPPGSGVRMGIDRDEDTLPNGVETNTGVFRAPPTREPTRRSPIRDGDGSNDDVEIAAGTDPNSPLSFPGGPVCGDTVVEAPEQCDDGNTTPGRWMLRALPDRSARRRPGARRVRNARSHRAADERCRLDRASPARELTGL